jgi:filamentous hemagglutinin
MGSGIHGGFGNTKGSRENKRNNTNDKVSLPTNQSQLKHIFRNEKGHLKNTLANQKLIVDLANNKKHFKGKDKYGNSWNVRIDKKGRQLWVVHQNGKISEGGRNSTPREWDTLTGLNNNPFKKGR